MDSNLAHHHTENFRLRLDLKNTLRHDFIIKMIALYNRTDKGYNRGAINVKLNCSFRYFQLLVSTLTNHTNVSESPRNQMEFKCF